VPGVWLYVSADDLSGNYFFRLGTKRAFERVGKTSGLGVRRWHCNRVAPMDHLFTEVPVTARWGLSAGHHGVTTGAAPPNFFFEGGQVTPLSWKCPEVWGCTA
jgi:hypothetical protein